MQALVIELRYYYGRAVVRLLGPLQSTLGLAPLVFNIVPYVFIFLWGGLMEVDFFLPFLCTEEEQQRGII